MSPGLTWGKILSTCVMSMWSDNIKCKYMFMFPLKNLARKGLIHVRKRDPRLTIHTDQVDPSDITHHYRTCNISYPDNDYNIWNGYIFWKWKGLINIHGLQHCYWFFCCQEIWPYKEDSMVVYNQSVYHNISDKHDSMVKEVHCLTNCPVVIMKEQIVKHTTHTIVSWPNPKQ